MNILQKDLEIKEEYSRGISELFLDRYYDPASRERIIKWYELDKNLFRYYLQINLSGSNKLPSDSLNALIEKFNTRTFNSVKQISPISGVEILKDSLDLLKFKNEFLSKVIDLQMLLFSNTDRKHFSCWAQPYIIAFIPDKKILKTDDSLNALVFLYSKPEIKVKIHYKLFKGEHLIYSGIIKDNSFKYKNLLKGNYRLECTAYETREEIIDFPEKYMPLAISNREFEVK